MSENPCWQYRRGVDGGVESRVFAGLGDVPKNQGWADSPAAIKADKPKAPRRKEK